MCIERKGEVKEGEEVRVRKQKVSLLDFRERDKPTLCFVVFCFISLCFLTKEEERGWLCVDFILVYLFITIYFFIFIFKSNIIYFISFIFICYVFLYYFVEKKGKNQSLKP